MAVAGSSRRNTHFMTASLTVSIVGILLAFEFIAEVFPLKRIVALELPTASECSGSLHG